MRFRSFKYFVKEGFAGLFKNRMNAFISFSIVAACLFIVILSYCVAGNLDYILKQIEDSIGITAILKDDVKARDVTRVCEEIKQIPHVTEANFISADQAMEELIEIYGEDIIIGDIMENNPLSKSIAIFIDDLQYQKDVVDAVHHVEGVKNVREAREVTNMLIVINKVIRIGSLIIIFIMSVTSVFIIINTIKISLQIRKNEISIMKYVGATDWFIRWPFIVEGIIIGVFGALLPIVISFFLYGKAYQLFYSIEFLDFVEYRTSMDIFKSLIPICLAGGIFLGVTGSVSSIRKYLKA